jgi:hypothetical protein
MSVIILSHRSAIEVFASSKYELGDFLPALSTGVTHLLCIVLDPSALVRKHLDETDSSMGASVAQT